MQQLRRLAWALALATRQCTKKTHFRVYISGETVQMSRLVWALAARICYKNKIYSVSVRTRRYARGHVRTNRDCSDFACYNMPLILKSSQHFDFLYLLHLRGGKV